MVSAGRVSEEIRRGLRVRGGRGGLPLVVRRLAEKVLAPHYQAGDRAGRLRAWVGLGAAQASLGEAVHTPMGRLPDKIAIVTGAGQGIGRAIAGKLAAEGATVVATDVNEAAAKDTAGALGGGAISLPADVTSREPVAAMIRQVHGQFGRIDILVNNAGWDKGELFVDSSPADWDRAIAVNLYGVLHTCHAVLPIMAAQGHGAIVNIGSDAGRAGSSGEAVYSAAKGGVIAFTKTIAREMARHHVNVNCVCPGPTDTALFDAVTRGNDKLREGLTRAIPFRRLARPADIAAAVAFLASDEACYITGQTLSVSGGLTMS